MKNDTKWNIKFNNKYQKNTLSNTNTELHEQFETTYLNFQQPLLKTIFPFPKSSTNIEKNKEQNTESFLSFDDTNSNFKKTPLQTAKLHAEFMSSKIENMESSERSKYLTKEIAKYKGNFVEPNLGIPIKFEKNEVGSDGNYSITQYNNNTYLNGYNCNTDGCDMKGIDISGVDPKGVNTPKLLYFRNGGNIMIDASTLDLSGVTFGGNTLAKYLKGEPKSSQYMGTIPSGPPLSYTEDDIQINSNLPSANSSDKLNLTQTNPFITQPTTRTNPYTSTTTMNTPTTENLSNNPNLNTFSIQGTNTFDTSTLDVNASYNNIINFWTNHIANNIIQYNPIEICQNNLIWIYNNLFINLFNGKYQLNAYNYIFFNYYIFILLILCILITYNLFYVLFYKSNGVGMYFPQFDKMPDLFIFKYVIGPVKFIYNGLRKMSDILVNFLEKMEQSGFLEKNDRYKIIFVLLFLFSI